MQDHGLKKVIIPKRKKINNRKKVNKRPRDNEHLADVLENYDDKWTVIKLQGYTKAGVTFICSIVSSVSVTQAVLLCYTEAHIVFY